MQNAGLANIEISGLESALSTLVHGTVQLGLKLIVAAVIFGVGMRLASRLTASFARAMERRKLEASARSFLVSFINILAKGFVFIIVLTTLGVQMTSIVAVLGAASLAIGMALQGTLQNFAGGLIILMFKPFRVGDTIETASGKTGIVKKIAIFTTELRTFDNQVVFLPNGALANGIITNLSNGTNRRADLEIGIAYGDNVGTARKVILDVLAADARVLADPAPSVFVARLSDSAVVLTVRFWSRYADMAAATADITEKIYVNLPKKKVNFPFPQMDVHIVK